MNKVRCAYFPTLANGTPRNNAKNPQTIYLQSDMNGMKASRKSICIGGEHEVDVEAITYFAPNSVSSIFQHSHSADLLFLLIEKPTGRRWAG